MKTILLDTPHRGYAEVKMIHRRDVEARKYLFVTFQYGDTVDDKWVAGELQVEEKLLKNIEQILDGKGGEIRPADPVYDNLIDVGYPKVSFTDKNGRPGWKKLTRPHPVHGDLDLWVQLSNSAATANILDHALAEGWFEGTVQ